MKAVKECVGKIAGRAAAYLLPADDTSIASIILGTYYHTNGYFRFHEGDTLELRKRISGYGTRPVIKITGCMRGDRSNPTNADYYTFTLINEPMGDWSGWRDTGMVGEDAERVSIDTKTTKWEVERDFIPVDRKRKSIFRRALATINKTYSPYYEEVSGQQGISRN